MRVRIFRAGDSLGAAVWCIACETWKGDALPLSGKFGGIVRRVFRLLEGAGGLLGLDGVDLESFDEGFRFPGAGALCDDCREEMLGVLRQEAKTDADAGTSDGLWKVIDALEAENGD